MKLAQYLIFAIMLAFGGAQAYKFIASRAARAACSDYKVESEFSAVKFVNHAVEHDARDVYISDLSAKVPDPLNIDNPVTTVQVVARTIKRLGVVPAAFTKIDEQGLRGKATMVSKVGFATYTCNINFENRKVTASLGTW